MTTFADRSPLEEQIAHWREYLRRRRAIHGPDVEELEDHLRNQVAALTQGGLAGDEAFLVAVKRMGSLDALSREFALEHSERLWKQLVMTPGDGGAESAHATRTETLIVLGLAVAAALAVKVPALFGLELGGGGEFFYARNASLFVLPLLASYFAWKRGLDAVTCVWLTLAFAAAAVFANVFPFETGGDTEALTALHLPIAAWLVVGVAYAGGRWFTGGRRMDFVRFSGELLIYYVLIALGGGVLTAFTVMMFAAIKMNAEWFVQGWLIPCGAMGAVIVGSWLVEAKQSVIENMAPVLTRLFTPLFTVVLLTFLATMAWTGSPIDVEREVLIGFDLLLALVVGLVLYAASARDPRGTARLLRLAATVAGDERARGRRGGASGHRGPHLRARIHPQQSRGSRREPHLARQPRGLGVALCALPAQPRLVCRPGAMADRLPAGVLRVGGARGRRVSADVRLRLTELTSRAARAQARTGVRGTPSRSLVTRRMRASTAAPFGARGLYSQPVRELYGAINPMASIS